MVRVRKVVKEVRRREACGDGTGIVVWAGPEEESWGVDMALKMSGSFWLEYLEAGLGVGSSRCLKRGRVERCTRYHVISLVPTLPIYHRPLPSKRIMNM